MENFWGLKHTALDLRLLRLVLEDGLDLALVGRGQVFEVVGGEVQAVARARGATEIHICYKGLEMGRPMKVDARGDQAECLERGQWGEVFGTTYKK